MDLKQMLDGSAADIAAAVRSRKVSAAAIVQASLDRIERLEPKFNTFATLTADDALRQAQRVDALIAQGKDPGALAGVPVSVKDLIAVGGVRQTFGSLLLKDNIAPYDAPSVERLKAAGACIVGKTTTSELGSKGVGDSPLTGITRNPWNVAHTSGGSSAGAAAGVAAGMVPLALATDGGGSIRIPASFCGLFGIKATFGRVPVWPASAAPSLGHVGPLARNVRDAALMLSVIAGYDARDPAAIDARVPDFMRALGRGVQGMRIGWCADFGFGPVDAGIAQACRNLAFRLQSMGADLREVPVVFSEDPAPAWNHLFYGRIAQRLQELAPTEASMEQVNAALRAAAAYQRESGIGEARAQAMRLRTIAQAQELFTKVDVLLTPTMPVTAPLVGVDVPPGHEGRNAVDWSYFTYPFNLTGNPAASVPAGVSSAGMPIGLQVVGPMLGEESVLRVAAALEQIGRPGFPASRE